jgi:hypothetical protein
MPIFCGIDPDQIAPSPDYRLHPRFTGDNATAPEHTNVPIAS